MLRHIVLWKFCEEAGGKGRRENMEEVRRRLLELQGEIPEILSMEIGMGEGGCDMALVATFADREALSRYLDHPAHRAVSTLVSSVRQDRAAVDYTVEGEI